MLVTLILVPSPAAAQPLLPRWYRRMDDAIFGRSNDGLSLCDVAALIQNVPVADHLERGLADVVLAFTPFETPEADVWTIEQDGLAEFVSDAPLLRAALKACGKVVARTTAMPDPISFHRAMSRLGWRTAAMIEHQLDRGRRQGAAPPLDPGTSVAAPVTNGRLLRAAANAAAAWMRRKYERSVTRGQWMIAFSFCGSSRLDFTDFHPVVPPPDRLWADPFVVSQGDRAWVFVEELVYSEGKGTIAALEVRPDGTWSHPRTILRRPYHLSYPCVFSWNGDYYMLPESSANQTVELYRCREFPYDWEPAAVLMFKFAATDATIFEAEGRWWMYLATDSGDGAGFDRLWLYHAASPLGPWTPHRRNPLQCDVVGGRPGGRPFRRDGKLVRATQVGAPWYGHAIQLREIVTLTPDEWQEREIATIKPDWMPDAVGTHTLNVDGEVMVIDAVRRRVAVPLRSRRDPDATGV